MTRAYNAPRTLQTVKERAERLTMSLNNDKKPNGSVQSLLKDIGFLLKLIAEQEKALKRAQPREYVDHAMERDGVELMMSPGAS